VARAAGTRLAGAAAALGLAAGLALFVIRGLDGAALVLAGLGAAAALAGILAALAGLWPAGAWVGAALIGLDYVLVTWLPGGPVDASSPAVAAALLLTVELAHLSLRVPADARALARRLLALAGLGVGSAGLGWLLLLAASLPLPGGWVTTALGAAAAVAAMALVARVRRA